jgi:hypothetical protein
MVVHTCTPAAQEAETERQVGPDKSMRPYLKNKLKPKELRVWLKWWGMAQSSFPSNHPLTHQKKKNEGNKLYFILE